jgi:ribonuclease P protein component
MLSPENRLKKEKDIKRALAGKIAAGGAALSLRAAATDLPATRFCFVVSKRVSKKASARNLVKRRLRAAASALMRRIIPGFDCAVIARSGAEKKTYRELAVEMEKILAKSRLLAPQSL